MHSCHYLNFAEFWQDECVNSQPKPRHNMEDKHLTSAGNYTDESIRTMEGMKHIRLRPGMYIGGLGNGEV